MTKKLSTIFVFLAILLLNSSSALAYYTNMPASVVVGQANFTSGSADQGGTTAANTLRMVYQGIVVQGKLVVGDADNSRVLIYNSIPTSNNASADVVIGQQNMTSRSVNQGGSAGANTLRFPSGIATDGTKLFITDGNNNRLLIFNSVPTSNNASADVVVGQPDMTTTSSGTTASKTSGIYGVGYDPATGKLFVADTMNSRVLIYNQVPTTNGATADVVIGQANFTSGSANQGGSVAANTLYKPNGVTVVGNKLIISDYYNFRILIYNSIPTSNNASADVVIGQPNMTSANENQGGTAAANTLGYAYNVAYDGKRLFVGDGYTNNRILIFNNIPSTNNASADIVIGQPNFTSSSLNQGGTPGANTINGADQDGGYLTVYGNQLIYGDTGNNRLLIYNNIDSTPLINLGIPDVTSNQKIKISGNVILGEHGKYSVQKVTASVNGESPVNVTSLSGGRDNDPGTTIYDFFHEFNPEVSGGSSDNYSVLFKAMSFNGETSQAFYFKPFTFESVSSGRVFTFSVNKSQIDKIKANVSKFEIWSKKVGTNDWQKYVGEISTDRIDSEGKVVVNQVGKIENSGNYEFKIKALSKDSNYSLDSNTLTSKLFKTTPFNPFSLPIFSGWFPIQINSITGSNVALVSSLKPTNDFGSYISSTFTPTIRGVAFSNSTIALVVTDEETNRTRVYTTKATNSMFTLKPTLFRKSIIDISVYDQESRFNALPPFRVTVQ